MTQQPAISKRLHPAHPAGSARPALVLISSEPELLPSASTAARRAHPAAASLDDTPRPGGDPTAASIGGTPRPRLVLVPDAGGDASA